VTFQVHNRGPSTHEFVVVRTGIAASRLPLKTDGLTINEESSALHPVGSVEELDIAHDHALRLHLKPGHYIIFCNLEGHYLGGMRASLDVG